MRTPRHLAALVAVLLAAPATALAQDTTPTTTEPLGDYTQTTPTETIETQTTETQTTETETTQTDDSGVADDSTSGGGGTDSGPAPSSAGEGTTGQQPQQQPQALAFTGFESFAVAIIGLALMGGAVVLQRRRHA